MRRAIPRKRSLYAMTSFFVRVSTIVSTVEWKVYSDVFALFSFIHSNVTTNFPIQPHLFCHS